MERKECGRKLLLFSLKKLNKIKWYQLKFLLNWSSSEGADNTHDDEGEGEKGNADESNLGGWGVKSI